MGIHKNLFNDSEHISPEFVCSLCTHIFLQPYQVLCSQDHIFCKACLSSYIEKYNQGSQQVAPESGSTLSNHEANRQLGRAELTPYEDVQSQIGKEKLDTQQRTSRNLLLNKSIAVECPGCEQMGKPSGPLLVSSFRPARFVERIIQAQRMRCPTTMSRSCQWNGQMKDMKQHLAVCGFAVELLCPHHLFGCTFRGAAADIITHMSCCPFSLHDISTFSGNTGDSSFRVTEYAAPLSPPQSSPIRPPAASVHYHYHQNGDHHGESQNSIDFVHDDGFQTPSMHNLQEGEINSAEGTVPDRMEENIDHDTFIERLEDLDMTDMTVSPVTTPLPTRNTSLPSFRHAQTPLSSTAPTRRRRLIVEEESDQSVTDETAKDTLNNTDAATYLNNKQTPQGEVIQQTDYSPRENDQDNILDSNKKNRVLKDITMLPSRKSEKLLGQMIQTQQQSQEQPQQSQEQLQQSQEKPQQQGLQYQMRGQQGQQNTQQSITQRNGSSSTNTTQDQGTRRSLQPRGPRQAQRTEAMSQASSIGSMADISSSVSSVVSPLAGVRIPNPSPNLVSVVESVVMAPQANLTNIFAMTQSTRFYVAEPSAYLPLLVHVPRYLRSRRKRSRQGRSVIRRMTPIVLSTNCNDQAKLASGETPTPDITSPENSYLSHNVSMSADSQSTGGDA